MRLCCTALAALLCLYPAFAQGGLGGLGALPEQTGPRPSPLLSEGQGAVGSYSTPLEKPRAAWFGEPSRESSPAWFLALAGVSPYAECQAVGVPLPPSPAEVAALPPLRRLQEQSALKAVWMERLTGAREERNRVSRENLSRSLLLAKKLGTPAAFVEILRRQATGDLSARERYVLDSAQRALLAAYGVSELDLRFYVEGCGLSPKALREVAAWLPLPTLFNVPASSADASVSASKLGADYVELLAVRRDLAAVWRGVSDGASADAAAEALLPALARYHSAQLSLLMVSESLLSSAIAPYARYAAPVNAAYMRERARLHENGWYGSSRLQALEYLFR